jgi:hypothetical protein
MNAHVPIPAVTATPAWFAELCDNRALLFADGVLDLHEAVDELEAYARLSGLNRRIGRNTVQHLMAAAFGADVRLCKNCDRTIYQHYRVTTPKGPEFFCDDLEAMMRQRAIELEREFWRVIHLDDSESLKRLFAQHPFDVPALLELYERKNAA